MARDTYEIGSSPNGEDCAQVGSDGYRERAQRECRAYMEQLKRAFPNMPDGVYLKITSNPHDFGSYHEVAVVYNDSSEEHCDYVFGNAEKDMAGLENGCEEWDEQARKELGLVEMEDGGVADGAYVKLDLDDEELEEIVFASVVPACCSSGCQVEPDGRCQHGNPSVLLDMGLI